MMDPGSVLSIVGTGLAATKTGADLVSKLRTAIKGSDIDPDEIRRLSSEIYDQILDAKRALIEVEDGLHDLKRRSDQFSGYELAKLPAGGWVWERRPTDDDETPHHFICPTCRGKDRFSPLQDDGELLCCRACDSNFWKRLSSGHDDLGNETY